MDMLGVDVGGLLSVDSWVTNMVLNLPLQIVRPKEKMKTIVELDGFPRIYMPTHPLNRTAEAIEARLSEPLF
ncbi:hypothetical protein TNCT_329121 [Trichonephila clavata]|uniref:Uncharacterized protein n=1 Tax=Trichonephila clavata TaxID=2740835 RepID=A0A8X6M4L8_TRICU|nr:hypothetical protein TNCT_329121 [Trichonephila clavata]